VSVLTFCVLPLATEYVPEAIILRDNCGER
jgi:hypothetical protein